MLASNSLSSDIFFTSVKTSPFSRSFLLLKAAHDRSKNYAKPNHDSTFSFSPSSTSTSLLQDLPPHMMAANDSNLVSTSTSTSTSTSSSSTTLTSTLSPASKSVLATILSSSPLTPASKGILKRKCNHLCNGDEDSPSNKKKVIFANPVVSQTKVYDPPETMRLKRPNIIRRRLSTEPNVVSNQDPSLLKIILTTDETLDVAAIESNLVNENNSNNNNNDDDDNNNNNNNTKSNPSNNVQKSPIVSSLSNNSKIFRPYLDCTQTEAKQPATNACKETDQALNLVRGECNNIVNDDVNNKSECLSNCDTTKSASESLQIHTNCNPNYNTSSSDHVPLHQSLARCKESVDTFLENAFSILSAKVKAWFNIKGISTVGQLATLSKNELTLPPPCPINEEVYLF